MELTERQWERLAYGAAHEILRQAIDNGELPNVEFEEFLPSDFDKADQTIWSAEFMNTLQQKIEGLVMSDLFEEQAKRD